MHIPSPMPHEQRASVPPTTPPYATVVHLLRLVRHPAERRLAKKRKERKERKKRTGRKKEEYRLAKKQTMKKREERLGREGVPPAHGSATVPLAAGSTAAVKGVLGGGSVVDGEGDGEGEGRGGREERRVGRMEGGGGREREKRSRGGGRRMKDCQCVGEAVEFRIHLTYNNFNKVSEREAGAGSSVSEHLKRKAPDDDRLRTHLEHDGAEVAPEESVTSKKKRKIQYARRARGIRRRHSQSGECADNSNKSVVVFASGCRCHPGNAGITRPGPNFSEVDSDSFFSPLCVTPVGA
ncbi:hypothetical protein B0H11DRAFT_1911579 [Mycena galericulata]|nr:hypothetical protein B0H11DRAFT_1911579 [Mycena galericulata]